MVLSCYIISIVTLSRLSRHSVFGNERQLSRAPHRTCADADAVKLPHPCPCSGSLFTLDNVCFYEVPGLRQIAWRAVLSLPLLLLTRARGKWGQRGWAPSRARGGSWVGAVRGLYLGDNQVTRVPWPGLSRQTINQTITFVVCDLRLRPGKNAPCALRTKWN